MGRAGGGLFDWLFEAGPGREVGAYAWRNMKQDARLAFDGSASGEGYDGGFEGLLPLLSGLDNSEQRPKLHLVGHSAGAIVLGHLLSSLKRFKLKNLDIASIHLMAPACTVPFFNDNYGPYLKGDGGVKLKDKIYLYDLGDAAERTDTVSANIALLPSYSHSLLYLVSRAFEDRPPSGPKPLEQVPLAGMQIFFDQMPKSQKLVVDYAGKDGKTRSTSHGGFDNDVATLTTIMSRVLGKDAPLPPTENELTGY
jgi:hypothetical protein